MAGVEYSPIQPPSPYLHSKAPVLQTHSAEPVSQSLSWVRHQNRLNNTASSPACSIPSWASSPGTSPPLLPRKNSSLPSSAHLSLTSTTFWQLDLSKSKCEMLCNNSTYHAPHTMHADNEQFCYKTHKFSKTCYWQYLTVLKRN